MFRRKHCKGGIASDSETATKLNPGSRSRPSLCTGEKTSGALMVGVHTFMPTLPTATYLGTVHQLMNLIPVDSLMTD